MPAYMGQRSLGICNVHNHDGDQGNMNKLEFLSQGMETEDQKHERV